MNTYAHVLVNAALGKALETRGIRPHYRALVIGSFMPDIPLGVLSVGYIGYHALMGNQSALEAATEAWDRLFFTDPLWISAHHLFHAPLLVLLWLTLGGLAWRAGKSWGRFVVWFSGGSLLHTLADIPTHHSDGPLVFFPLNWTYRYRSPVSYWEVEHYAREFLIFESALTLVLLIYFLAEWRKRRQRRAAQQAHTG